MLLLDRRPPKNQDDLGSRTRNLSCGYATCTAVTTMRMHRHLMGNRERAGQGTQVRMVRVLSRDHGNRNAILKGRQAGRWATRPWIAAHFGMDGEQRSPLGRRLLVRCRMPLQNRARRYPGERSGKERVPGRTADWRRGLGISSPVPCRKDSMCLNRQQSPADPSSRSSLSPAPR